MGRSIKTDAKKKIHFFKKIKKILVFFSKKRKIKKKKREPFFHYLFFLVTGILIGRNFDFIEKKLDLYECSDEKCIEEEKGYCSEHLFLCMQKYPKPCNSELSQEKEYCSEHKFRCLSSSCPVRFPSEEKFCSHHKLTIKLEEGFQTNIVVKEPITICSPSLFLDYVYLRKYRHAEIYSLETGKSLSLVDVLPQDRSSNVLWETNEVFYVFTLPSEEEKKLIWAKLSVTDDAGKVFPSSWIPKTQGNFLDCFLTLEGLWALYQIENGVEIWKVGQEEKSEFLEVGSIKKIEKLASSLVMLSSNGFIWFYSIENKNLTKSDQSFSTGYICNRSSKRLLFYEEKSKDVYFVSPQNLSEKVLSWPSLPLYHKNKKWADVAFLGKLGNETIVWADEKSRLNYYVWLEQKQASLYNFDSETDQIRDIAIWQNKIMVFLYSADEKIISMGKLVFKID